MIVDPLVPPVPPDPPGCDVVTLWAVDQVVPAAFVAPTRNLYVEPAVSPLTVQLVLPAESVPNMAHEPLTMASTA